MRCMCSSASLSCGKHDSDAFVCQSPIFCIAGRRLAKVQADGDASDEEEEWYDASEEVDTVPMPADGSWWEQDNVDAADVEAHLLKDIHQKGMNFNTLCTCQCSLTCGVPGLSC